MKTVGELPLRETPVVEPSASLEEATLLMRDSPLKTVVLVGDEQFMGIFNEEALLSNLIPADVDAADLAVGPYVHPVRMTVDPSMPIDMALAQAKRRHVSVLPVVRGTANYLGVVTLRDLEAA